MPPAEPARAMMVYAFQAHIDCRHRAPLARRHFIDAALAHIFLEESKQLTLTASRAPQADYDSGSAFSASLTATAI